MNLVNINFLLNIWVLFCAFAAVATKHKTKMILLKVLIVEEV